MEKKICMKKEYMYISQLGFLDDISFHLVGSTA